MDETVDGFIVPGARVKGNVAASKTVKEKAEEEQVHKKEREQPPPFKPIYKVPDWDTVPIYPYKLQVLKQGKIIDEIDISKEAHFLFGRLPQCDIELLHPLVSRQHAVLQHRSNGTVYIYDLASTHKTKIGKNHNQTLHILYS